MVDGKRDASIMVEMVMSLYRKISNLLEEVSSYNLYIDNELYGEYPILGQVSDALFEELGRVYIPVTWSDENSFEFQDKEIKINVKSGTSTRSLNKEERVEISVLIAGEEDMGEEELKEIEQASETGE